MNWTAIAAARARDEAARVPFTIGGVHVGSVARAHLPALAELGSALRVAGAEVALTAPAAERDAALAQVNAELRARGRIVGWRDETYTIVDPATQRVLAHTERAAARFWGTLTFGAHASGYVAGPDGRPAHLWIAERSPTKPTDPGKLDNLIGGGVPAGQTPAQTLEREGWEEAGLRPSQLRQARRGRVIRLCRDVPEGLQHEWLHAFDLALPAGLAPSNQDGEVAAFRLLPVAEALALAAGDAMTVDAALVTLDFALRHALLAGHEQHALETRAAGLWVRQG